MASYKEIFRRAITKTEIFTQKTQIFHLKFP